MSLATVPPNTITDCKNSIQSTYFDTWIGLLVGLKRQVKYFQFKTILFDAVSMHFAGKKKQKADEWNMFKIEVA